MAGTLSADTITSASDLVATYDVEAVNLVLTGTITGTTGVTSTGNVGAVKGAFSGSVSASSGAITNNFSVGGSSVHTGLASFGANVAVTGSVSASSAALTGHFSIGGSTLHTGVGSFADDIEVTGCAYAPTFAIDALSSTAIPTITAASYAPGAANYAWPGSLWICTATSGAAGSTVANAAWYMNASASGATGSTWTQLAAMVA